MPSFDAPSPPPGRGQRALDRVNGLSRRGKAGLAGGIVVGVVALSVIGNASSRRASPEGQPPTTAAQLTEVLVTTAAPTTTAVAPTTTAVATAVVQVTTPVAAIPPVTEAPALVVTHVVDGDTLDVSSGERVRLIGIDTPEVGQCGADEASAALEAMVGGRPVSLIAVPGRDDRDRYGRLLRYVEVDGNDAGLALIRAGLAIARYDSRDGYGAHPQEQAYVAADEAAGSPVCAAAAPPPAPLAADGLDPQFRTCKLAIAAGYGPYYAGVDPEYDWYRDADGDGKVCER